jgi:hypothetical protein
MMMKMSRQGTRPGTGSKLTQLFRRGAIAFAASTLLAVGSSVGTATPASADFCRAGLCGEAANNTPWVMYTTADSGGHRCDVWNSGGGSTWSRDLWWCYHVALDPGGHRGGGTTDVDAVTFSDRDYVVDWGALGTNDRLVTRGMWTKIQTDQDVNCWNSGGRPHCRVTLDYTP